MFFLGCLFGNVDAIKWQEPRKFWAWPYFTLGTMTNTWQGKLLNYNILVLKCFQT